MIEDYMKRAIKCSCDNVKNGGGPFGAVIVKDGKIIAEGTNLVTINNDPTAHAEVVAIRKLRLILMILTFRVAKFILLANRVLCVLAQFIGLE
jgi:tRNA(Arg) A34 adenosine deaminase TadA